MIACLFVSSCSLDLSFIKKKRSVSSNFNLHLCVHVILQLTMPGKRHVRLINLVSVEPFYMCDSCWHFFFKVEFDIIIFLFLGKVAGGVCMGGSEAFPGTL